jgi:hypothetical protein
VDAVSAYLRKRLDRPANEVTVLAHDIKEWAQADDGGWLPEPSAHAFAGWLEDTWGEFADEGEETVERVLRGALSEWCGGRS